MNVYPKPYISGLTFFLQISNGISSQQKNILSGLVYYMFFFESKCIKLFSVSARTLASSVNANVSCLLGNRPTMKMQRHLPRFPIDRLLSGHKTIQNKNLSLSSSWEGVSFWRAFCNSGPIKKMAVAFGADKRGRRLGWKSQTLLPFLFLVIIQKRRFRILHRDYKTER